MLFGFGGLGFVVEFLVGGLVGLVGLGGLVHLSWVGWWVGLFCWVGVWLVFWRCLCLILFIWCGVFWFGFGLWVGFYVLRVVFVWVGRVSVVVCCVGLWIDSVCGGWLFRVGFVCGLLVCLLFGGFCGLRVGLGLVAS